MRLRHSILALSMLTALLSWGCPADNPISNASSETAAKQVEPECSIHPTLPQCQTTNAPTTSGTGTPIYSVPEPGTLMLVGAGVCWLLWQRRR